MSDLYLVLKNLTRSKLRLALTLFATFIAFMVYGVLASFQSYLNSGIDLAADDRLVVINKINFTQSLPISYVNRVRAVENVVDVAHLNWFGGYYQDPKNLVVTIAVSPESFVRVYPELVMTEDEKKAWLDNRQGLIVGEKVAQTYGWKVGDRIPLNSNIFSQTNGRTDWDFDIEAIYSGADEQADTSSLYFHYNYFNETQSFGRDRIGWMAVRTNDSSNNEAVINAIDGLFENTQAETESMPEKAFNQAFIEQIGNIGLIVSSVVLAAFFIILVIVGNSMVLSIRERTREIGVMKTLGFKSTRIFGMVLAESLAIALIGGLLGLAAAAGLTSLTSGMGAQVPTLILDREIAAKAIGIMLLMGLITGIIPAFNALRLNIISSLSRS
ncbi:MAG: FtsX-like permease family protein [Pseudomonadota bacterium]